MGSADPLGPPLGPPLCSQRSSAGTKPNIPTFDPRCSSSRFRGEAHESDLDVPMDSRVQAKKAPT